MKIVISIDDKPDVSNARQMVEQLNEEILYLKEEFGQLGVQIEGKFDVDQFHDDIVYVSEEKRISTMEDFGAIGRLLRGVIVPVGAPIYRDYAEKNNVPYTEEDPRG